MPQHEQRTGVSLTLPSGELRRRKARPAVGALTRLLILEAFFDLPRIIAGLVGVLRLRRQADHGRARICAHRQQANSDGARGVATSP